MYYETIFVANYMSIAVLIVRCSKNNLKLTIIYSSKIKVLILKIGG